MAWIVPESAVLRPDETHSGDSDGNKKKSVAWEGLYGKLEAAGKNLAAGDVIVTGWTYESHELRRVAGDLGILTINCIPAGSGDGGDSGASGGGDAPLKDIWSVRSVRNDVSIMAYCGPNVRNPNRALVEAWMKEPDGKLAKAHQYRSPDGEIVHLETEAATIELVQKIEAGVEAVIRFYPVVCRTRTYAAEPPACLENLGYIDTPPAPGEKSKRPGALSTAISAHQWLKVQDDANQQPDGKWTRTESWMGIKKTEANSGEPWDADLYGANRWGMPYFH